MQISPPAMVCQTKIVADEEMPGAKNDPMVSSSQMWSPQPLGSSSPAAAPLDAAPGEPRRSRDSVFIREFELSDWESVRRIFFEGIMERIPNTAIRGLKQQPRVLLLYLCLTVMCFYLTKSLLLMCCVPILLLGSRYHYSRKVIVSYLECALQTDMSDIEQYYMKPAGHLVWYMKGNGINWVQSVVDIWNSFHLSKRVGRDYLNHDNVDFARLEEMELWSCSVMTPLPPVALVRVPELSWSSSSLPVSSIAVPELSLSSPLSRCRFSYSP
ncbi:N-acetylaspartate synthetase-like, partial [Narcine bancroftii]|uniref:N-acetylaspartate synthetase-like n=1 Tax=Narcine bancroftii TaxID=1343680 RepID=UPI0038317E3F